MSKNLKSTKKDPSARKLTVELETRILVYITRTKSLYTLRLVCKDWMRIIQKTHNIPNRKALVTTINGAITGLKQEIKSALASSKDANGPEYMKANCSNIPNVYKPLKSCLVLTKGHLKTIQALSWAHNNPELLLSAGVDGRLLVWHAPTGNKLAMAKLSSSWVQTCSFRAGSDVKTGLAASAGMDNLCSIFTIDEDLKLQQEMKGHEAAIPACSFLNDDTVITASADSTCILWDIKKNAVGRKIRVGEECTSLLLPYGDDPSYFVVGCCDGSVRGCDYKSGTIFSNYKVHKEAVSLLAAFPNGYGYATGSDDNICRMFDIRAADSLVQEYDISEHDDDPDMDLKAITFSKSGRYLFAGYSKGCAAWDTVRATPAYIFGEGSSTMAINCAGTALCVAHITEPDANLFCLWEKQKK